jgi:hypothetical protein
MLRPYDAWRTLNPGFAIPWPIHVETGKVTSNGGFVRRVFSRRRSVRWPRFGKRRLQAPRVCNLRYLRAILEGAHLVDPRLGSLVGDRGKLPVRGSIRAGIVTRLARRLALPRCLKTPRVKYRLVPRKSGHLNGRCLSRFVARDFLVQPGPRLACALNGQEKMAKNGGFSRRKSAIFPSLDPGPPNTSR